MIIDCFGTDFQPVVFVVISNPETSSPVTESIGFQPKPLRYHFGDNDSDNDSNGVITPHSLLIPL